MLEERIRQLIDNKTKPLGALGRLEDLALQIALLQQTETPRLENPHVLVFAADHGLTAEGVSAYPADVTFGMVHNFMAGGAAINVFCKQNGLSLLVCDVGVNGSFDQAGPTLVKYKIRPGTRNMRYEPAMTPDECAAAMDAGRTLVDGVRHRDCNIVGFGEMGIGNTSAAALLMHRFTGFPLPQCVGRGTGLDDAGVARKLAVLQAVAERHADATQPLDVLTAVGGLEIAAIAGGMLQAAENGMLILVDGFIATSALLVAHALNPSILKNCIFCHQSDEAGHRFMLDFLGAKPLLNLDLRLGEGTGCALAYPLIQAAVGMLNDMATMDVL
ncbi:nicotinate-nucleotide--dimethylbenzimidazole phosphoribosyltransferase [Spirosoma montaniterrae]|uniref:Nicotinate-nucleotide--dimethylbenzimidazole phosphoribosyltransferase n=1 Tax=Spirosoma montaniterrae TaxID=1178516 RepID=A0A1P9WVB3_9BACT|nr:nicotinate-nucleotide--dimethylbenzimidazole phosphoribosyltransferase [Spirosoma montaniterrae]AQG79332.1 nicotinate-nucleotide--dimethylbenzimidazole phosphoribosyltransferase [Spirosoma montaniterrae]